MPISVDGASVFPLVFKTRLEQHTLPPGDTAKYEHVALEPLLHSLKIELAINAALFPDPGALTGMSVS